MVAVGAYVMLYYGQPKRLSVHASGDSCETWKFHRSSSTPRGKHTCAFLSGFRSGLSRASQEIRGANAFLMLSEILNTFKGTGEMSMKGYITKKAFAVSVAGMAFFAFAPVW